MAFVNGAALALVNEVTMAAMSSPDPTPWEEITVLGDAAEDAVEAVEIGVLMMVLKVRRRINQFIGDARNNLSKSRTTIGGSAGALSRRRSRVSRGGALT
jgi:hypothetical protein